jgi:trk system potassium uptake protein TrkA
VRAVLDFLGPENVEHVSTMDENIELLEVELPGDFRPRPLKALAEPQVVPVALERDHRVMLYREDLSALPGDRLFLVAAREVADEAVARIAR